MEHRDAAMLAYVKLAGLSQSRRQLGPRDKFLVLAASSACEAGWLPVAERCRELVLANNPHHLLGQYADFVSAMRDDDFQPFLKQLARFCSYERAEHLLATLDIAPELPPVSAKLSPGDYALLLLGHSEAKPADTPPELS